MREAVEAALELGEFRGAVNCAGVASAEKVLGREGPHSLDSFAKVVQVNLVGTFNVIRLAAEAMSQQRTIREWGAGRHRQHGQRGGFRRPDRAGGLRRVQGRRRLPDPPRSPRARQKRHPRHDHSPRHLRHPDDGRPARRRPRVFGRSGPLPLASRASPRSTRISSSTSWRTRCSTARSSGSTARSGWLRSSRS